MQLQDLKPNKSQKTRKRIARGGKRGTYAGRGQKGQKSRAGSSIKPGFRGGDKPIWKSFPKQRGASKKVKVKHRKFSIKPTKPEVVNLSKISKFFKVGDVVSKRSLIKKGIIPTGKKGVKILGTGSLDHKVEFNGVFISKSATEKINKAGGTIKK